MAPTNEVGLRSLDVSTIASNTEGDYKEEYSVDHCSTPPDAAPDGGMRAWLVVLGGMCNFFATFGLVNSWGVFQTYYSRTYLPNVDQSDIAWIGSIQYALMFLPGLIAGRLFDMGHFKIVQLIASIVLVVATVLIAECRLYWQLILCQGVAVGLSCGCIFGPTMSCVAQWFDKKRATALGIVSVGSSLGGTCLPLVFRSLIVRTSFAWTVRSIAAILFAMLFVSNMTLKRLPTKQLLPRGKPTGGLIDLRAFQSLPFSVYAVSGFVTFLGSSTLLSYLSTSASQAGIPQTTAISLLSIANACSILGRVGSGVLGDRIGAMNVMIPFTGAASIITYAWPFAKQEGWFVVIAALFGISSGAYVGLSVVPIVAMGDTASVGRRIGTFQTVISLGALAGIPIAGRIRDVTHGFHFVGIYAGTMVMLAVMLMCVTRQVVMGRRVLGKI